VKTQHLRKDNTCLNCGTEVPDRFCSHCGQENVETKESFGHLLSHFFQDITHYDSKFVLTLKYLFTRPGLLTKQYVNGRRMDYVNPIRLYIFTSFVFFLILGIVNHADHDEETGKKVEAQLEKTGRKLEKRRALLLDSIAMGAKDSVQLKENLERIEELKEEVKQIDMAGIFFEGAGTPVKVGLARYDSLQNTLPKKERDGFIKRAVMKHTIKMKYDTASTQESINEGILHNFPKVMFLLLPFFALLLKWAYFRRKMLYAEHAIFSIHIHTFIFFLALIVMLLNQLLHYDDIYAWMFLIIYIYFIIALRQFYGGSIRKAILKSLLILACYGVGAIIIMLLFVITLAVLFT
jgi:hypothetical protein